MTKTVYMPVFTGGIFGDNEIVIGQENFLFDSEEELKQANEEIPFLSFFGPISTVFSRVHKVTDGFDGVEIIIGDTTVYCISGEWYESVE